MRRLILTLACAALVLLLPTGAGATTISLVGGSGSVAAITTTAGSAAEPWTITEGITAGPVVLRFDSSVGTASVLTPSFMGYAAGDWFEKTVTNNTGTAWTSFELELQSALGIPSTEGDGLSFGQGLGLTFTASKFSALTKLELTRDYLNFSGGSVGAGESVVFRFAITDNGANDPFWLVETPNKADTTVPEPASMLLLGTGLIGAVRAARRRRA